jgi:uncharacterized membrane protein
MKRFLVVPVIFFLICFVTPAFAQNYSSERILSFHSYIKIHPDSSMTVAETIRVVSTGNQIKRGIYRDFPTRYKDLSGNNYVVDFQVINVLRDGRKENYHIESLSNGKRVYIGSKDLYLSPSEYTYTLVYETNRQLGFFDNFDELYWNVTGNGWAFPIDEVSATVELPQGASAVIGEVDGYTGPQGAKAKDFTVFTDEYGNPTFTTTKGLRPQEGLTIVVSWPKGYVTEPTANEKLEYFASDNSGIIFGIISLLVVFGYYLFVWNNVGRDPAKGTIIPLYEPPNNLSPAGVRYTMKMGFDNKAFTAAIINIAVKGFITIEEVGKDYIIRKTKPGLKNKQTLLSRQERVMLGKLLGSWDSIELDNINHHKIRKALVYLEGFLKTNFEKVYFFTNIKYFIPGLILSIFLIAISAALQSAEKLPIAVFMSVWLTIWSFGVVALLRAIISKWRGVASNAQNKPFLLGSAITASIFSIPFVAGEIFGIGMLIFATSFSTLMILVFMVFLNVLFFNLLKAPTRAGRKVMDKIEGFKMYLSVAEQHRLNLLNPPDKTPELFEKYLSFALALDVENARAQAFSEVLTAAAESGNEYSPAWYHGTRWSSFGAAGFASNLGSSLSSTISSSSVAPGSSSGGGGGGGSGGGGGGGGGGGW